MGWYRSLARPLLFALPPETAHRVTSASLGLPLPWERLGGVRTPDPALRTEMAGLRFANPVGLAAGFDKDGRRVAALGRIGFGYVVTGTFTRRPRPGNARPRIVRDAARGSLVNAMGLPNPGAELAAATLRALPRPSPRIASIADEDARDVIETHALLEPHVDAIELNVSCPNVAWGRDRDNEAHLSRLLRELSERRTTPLLVKLPPFRTDVERGVVSALARIAVDGGANGLVCSNSLPATEPRLSTGSGGLSGRPLLPGTVRTIIEIRRVTEDELPVVACGGIGSASDALASLRAGATTIQLYTGLVFGGPGLVGEICAGVGRALRERRIDLTELAVQP